MGKYAHILILVKTAPHCLGCTDYIDARQKDTAQKIVLVLEDLKTNSQKNRTPIFLLASFLYTTYISESKMIFEAVCSLSTF